MASRGSLYSQTLQDITTTKLDELAKKCKAFEDQRLALAVTAEKEQDAVQKLIALSAGVKSCFGIPVSGGRVIRGTTPNSHLEIDLRNLDRFLKQARYDPSISSKTLEQWHQKLVCHLDVQSLKFSFASLYGHLTTEWLQTKQAAVVVPPPSEDTEMDDFEHVSGGKKMASRLTWENSVFDPAHVDSAAVLKLLKDIFDSSAEDSKSLETALRELLRSVRAFQTQLASPGGFNLHTLNWTISSISASDLLTDEKREVLKDFLRNPVIMSEIADVLNMRMSAIGSWSWGDEVPLEQRRQLNGSYKIYMHEDLLQAIFLQYIGVKWSVFWKRALSDLRKAKGVWKSLRTAIPSVDRKRREYFLGAVPDRPSVQSRKQKMYRRSYFLSQLLNTETQQVVGEEGDEEADLDIHTYQVQQAPQAPSAPPQNALMAMNRMGQAAFLATGSKRRRVVPASHDEEGDSESEDEESDSNNPKNPMEAKQNLLHLLSTEIIIKTRLHGEMTCFRSQFNNLYPSLPHATIIHVLRFFGVSEVWLNFFQRFLAAPLRFLDDDTLPRQRKRGTPGSHALSEVFGEVVLFCLDYRINQVAEGEHLWRLHDDFWFWSSDHHRCVKAWTTIETFSDIMGLSLNEAKSGSARMVKTMENGKRTIVAGEVQQPLPHGQIRWGMLCLNPDSGRFEIDQKMVSSHIDELEKQLKDKSSSVFAWIQAWNTYATTFFTSNFGKPANCFGRRHVDNMLATHQHIQRSVFSAMKDENRGESSSVVAYLKKTIEERFGVTDIPDGYFFWPVELGGLEVQSPFVRLLQIRDMVAEDPGLNIDVFAEAEKDAYKAARLKFETDGPQMSDQRFRPKDPDTFMSISEYIKYREELNYGFDNELVDVFDRLLNQPVQESIDIDDNGQIKVALSSLSHQSGLRGILANWHNMEPYWKWIAQLHGPELLECFGGFNIVDPGLLPIGMVSLFRSGRVKWQD